MTTHFIHNNKVYTKKVFDNWDSIKELKDCNSCERWWINQCDGTPQGSTKPCKEFLATRSVLIPEQIKRLQSSIKWLSASSALIGVSLVIHILSHIVGG